jgi:putative protease
MVSLNTQKSLGKFTGSVTNISENWFSISSNYTIHNNDGLCYINKKGVLSGFKVNSVSDNKIFPNQPVDLFVGAKIYRNFDHEFIKQLKQDSSSKRLIECTVNIEISNNIISFALVDEDQIVTRITHDSISDRAKDSVKFFGTLENQIMKTGNTEYNITKVNVKAIDHEIAFITIGQINSVRRDLIQKHTTKRIQIHKIIAEKIIPNTIPYPEKYLTHKANVSNSLAKKFYQRHGVKEIEDAFELQNNPSGKEIMEIKYCILYELGFCNGKQKKEEAFKKLFLKDNYRKYELEFNCKECKMNIKHP